MTDSINEPVILTAASQRRAAKMLNYGNIVSMALPALPVILWLTSGNLLYLVFAIPPLVLWFGMSMLLYAINRHHPNPAVGHHIQWAAYWYYGLVSPLVAVGIFIPKAYAATIIGSAYVIVAAILVIRSLIDNRRINHSHWQDIVVEETH